MTSVKYIDGNGTQQTASSGLYTLDSFNNPAVVRLDWDDTWPTHRGDARGIEIIYVAGYSSASAVPASIKAAILFQLEMMFDGVNPSLERAYERLIATSLEGSYP